MVQKLEITKEDFVEVSKKIYRMAKKDFNAYHSHRLNQVKGEETVATEIFKEYFPGKSAAGMKKEADE